MVYVDDAYIPYGRMIMCHMIADYPEELAGMARRIGIPLRYVQFEGNYKEHFDISKAKRMLAVQYGAKEISCKELVLRIQERNERRRISFPSRTAPKKVL